MPSSLYFGVPKVVYSTLRFLRTFPFSNSNESKVKNSFLSSK
jgi:hypothetical protein